jgi:hypothetical protein
LRFRQGHKHRSNTDQKIFLTQLRGQQSQSAGHENEISNPIRLENKEAHKWCRQFAGSAPIAKAIFFSLVVMGG